MAKFARVYRTYSYIDKNPVIDKVRTLVQDEGLFTKLGIVQEISNVSRSTLVGWFHGSVRHPQHHTIAAVVSALGYEEAFVKKHKLDIERERERAAEWAAKQPKRRKRSK
jgi:hypothetical protein